MLLNGFPSSLKACRLGSSKPSSGGSAEMLLSDRSSSVREVRFLNPCKQKLTEKKSRIQCQLVHQKRAGKSKDFIWDGSYELKLESKCPKEVKQSLNV